jgi:hypothetical protein
MTDFGAGPLNYASVNPAVQFRNWRAGAQVFGVLTIVVGSLCGCEGLFLPLFLLVQPGMAGGAQPRVLATAGIVSMTLVYIGTSAGLIWLGSGILRLRRWVRPLILSLGSLSFIYGLFALAMAALLLPQLRGAITQPGMRPVSQTAVTFGMIFGMVFIVIFMLIIPGAYVWFFHHANVKMMLEFYDPQPRWTDRCPIPVLCAVLILLIFAAMSLFLAPVGASIFFGRVIHGLPAIGIQLGLAIISLWLARSMFRLEWAGWRGTTAFSILIGVDYVTSAFIDPAQMQSFTFTSGANTAAQIAMMQKTFGTYGRLAMTAPLYFVMLGFLIYLRKYFTISRKIPPTIAPPALPNP